MAKLDTIGGLHYEMMKRCYNEKSVMYSCYGAKGIKVCEKWHDRSIFREWCNNNGYVKGMRVDRKDSDKNYCPENCVLGYKNTSKHGYNMMIKYRIARNKSVKKSVGLDKYSDSPVFKTYHGMLFRCYNPNCSGYENYGGRGIRICDEWISEHGFLRFHLWAMNNGWERDKSIDRIDVNGNYEPDNCRWATAKEQALNKRTTIYCEYKDNLTALSEIAKMENIKYGMLYRRVKSGMNVEDAIREVSAKTMQNIMDIK